MKTRLYRYPSQIHSDSNFKNTKKIATIGSFDGIHIGHTTLLKEVAKAKSDNGEDFQSVLISFYPHPAVKLGKVDDLPKLSNTRERLRILGEIGIDVLYLIHFTKALSNLSAEEFIRKIIIEKLNIISLFVGPDARLGHQAKGDIKFLAPILNRFGASLNVVSFVNSGATRASSRRIRELISSGDIKTANTLLGRHYTIEGKVEKGDGRGRQLGVPTANLTNFNKQHIPLNGVYATITTLEGIRYNSVTNIGIRPTFRLKSLNMETHLLDRQVDEFYGKRIRIEFIDRIRSEITFSSPEQLVMQIKSDLDIARKLLLVKY